MNDLTTREPANDPQDLERLLVERGNAGDVKGICLAGSSVVVEAEDSRAGSDQLQGTFLPPGKSFSSCATLIVPKGVNK